MQEAVLGFMISSMHEHFTGVSVGNRPMKVADGYFTLRVPEMSDAVWGAGSASHGPQRSSSRSTLCHRAGAPRSIALNWKSWSEPGRAGKRARKSGTGCASWIISARPCCPSAR